MGDSDRTAVIDRIHSTFQDVLARGLRPEAVAGATDSEIDGMAAAQGAPAVPAAVREVFRLIGDRKGPFLGGGGFFGVHGLREHAKEMALEFFDEVKAQPAEFGDPEQMLVLLYHGGYLVCVVDGADLDDPNPPVWLLEEDGELRRRWPTVADWFSGICGEVASLAERLAETRAQGQPDLDWADYFR
ncbi:SMI1/KNR4 family protein [Allokutzneria oryzae]|uniref:SMI1/KNR4 family protein n=1 Tax=Allokutzneria oryzae TaxID=1378989 RepID=A0ABV6AAL4_9PSEU